MQPTHRGWGVVLHLPEGNSLHKLFGIFCTGDLSRSNDIPIAMSTLTNQILISNTTGIFSKRADSRAGAGTIQDEAEVLNSA